jgi:acetyltransferase-like isoleucine patch superfamily enzyme
MSPRARAWSVVLRNVEPYKVVGNPARVLRDPEGG